MCSKSEMGYEIQDFFVVIYNHYYFTNESSSTRRKSSKKNNAILIFAIVHHSLTCVLGLPAIFFYRQQQMQLQAEENKEEEEHDELLPLDWLCFDLQFSGKAPVTSKEIKDYITDCGYPSSTFEPMDCPSCNVCCNSENLCSRQNQRIMRPTIFAGIFFLSLTVLLSFIYATKEKLMSINLIISRFEQSVMSLFCLNHFFFLFY